MSQYQPRVVPTPRPIFGENWPDPPDGAGAMRLAEGVTRPPSRALAWRLEGVAAILDLADTAEGALTESVEWLTRIGDRDHDDELHHAIGALRRIHDRYEGEMQ